MSEDKDARIKELEEQLKAQSEAAFIARKLLGEALAKMHPYKPLDRSQLHAVEEDCGWEGVHRLVRKRVYEVLHLGRMQAKSARNPEEIQAFEAALAELEKT